MSVAPLFGRSPRPLDAAAFVQGHATAESTRGLLVIVFAPDGATVGRFGKVAPAELALASVMLGHEAFDQTIEAMGGDSDDAG